VNNAITTMSKMTVATNMVSSTVRFATPLPGDGALNAARSRA
jgi:hypothetical protein